MQNLYQPVIQQQKDYFNAGNSRDINVRIAKLQRMKAWIEANSDKIAAALKQDLAKSYFESYTTEIMGVLTEIDLSIKRLKRWSKPKKVATPLTLFKASSQIIYEPYGLVLIISPWNYPFGLAATTLVGVIAAGNCCIIKPSEIACASATIVEEMVSSCFDEGHCRVIQGGVEQTTQLLQNRFDLIHFTGSTQVGKIIAQAAAEQLTPVVLELGGKSPCIIDETANITLTARRLCWGKFMNVGQTCIAPDFVAVHRDVKDALIKALRKTITDFYGAKPELSDDYGRIIDEKQFDRLTALLANKDIVCGGQRIREQRYIAPTVIDNVAWQDDIMQNEIFGPILPILVYDDLQQLIDRLKCRPKPLALYLFSTDKETQKRVINELQFGGGSINTTIMHIANPNLPFGGIGASGMGHYHGRWSFEAFSHKKSILNKSLMFDIKLIYPPFGDKLKWFKKR
jgi:aldehyde dehydrogenase (NAD+)